MRSLYRVSCVVDTVVAAPSADHARAYAEDEPHEVRIEELVEPEVMIPLDGEEAVLVLAAVERALPLAQGPDGDLLERLRARLADALAVIDEQDQLRVDT